MRVETMTMKIRLTSTLAATVLLAACSGGNGNGGGRVIEPENLAPTVAAIPDQSNTANLPVAPISIAVDDEDVAGLQVTVAADNTVLLPDGSLQLTGEGAIRRLTVVPAVDTVGDALLTVTATDGGGLTASQTFRLTITPQQQSFAEFVGSVFALPADAEPQPVNALELVPDLTDEDVAGLVGF